jgi:hypothetical protein
MCNADAAKRLRARDELLRGHDELVVAGLARLRK